MIIMGYNIKCSRYFEEMKIQAKGLELCRRPQLLDALKKIPSNNLRKIYDVNLWRITSDMRGHTHTILSRRNCLNAGIWLSERHQNAKTHLVYDKSFSDLI